ncbi:MAG: coproporphyrinogen oxidase [Rickettsiales bacterium]|jgi:putative membrane protein|nr:coproporphyrinogen oxidase [Rickettsiales bacterium]
MTEYYLWIKALHIISVISWMAGMLYLPRLFVYHTQVKVGSKEDQRFQLMERKLMRVIINPAMILSLIFGLMLIYITHAGYPGELKWFHAKALLLLGMFGLHGMFSKYRKSFAQGKNTKSEKFFRIINEIPAVLMIIIVVLAVVKPF